MNNPTLRCKLRVVEVLASKDSNGAVEQERVKLQAVINNTPENKEWSRWTPSASFEIWISNPEAFGKLSRDHEFFVDFTPAAMAADKPIPDEPVGT